MVNIRNVSKSFTNTPVLAGISLHVQKGTILGLAGASGSGKSTLLRCVQGLAKIDAGSIVCDGPTGFMFQDFQLFPHMTVLQNVLYAPSVHDPQGGHTAEALTLLAGLGLADKASAYPAELSGGQQQRVALARSLMMKPEILLCDEPTSGLDVATVSDVVALLKAVRAGGITMLVASHDLDFLTEIADRIVMLRNGELVLDTPMSLLEHPIDELKKYY
ncbi:MAG: ATP-binding cassette domain-containing protein [Candidatus Dependentiae bacterium]|nr:ATP-binding cassette domain-containing protein [Candidatus Dependentiae bacterium]